MEDYTTPLGDSWKMEAQITPSRNRHWGLKKRGELRKKTVAKLGLEPDTASKLYSPRPHLIYQRYATLK